MHERRVYKAEDMVHDGKQYYRAHTVVTAMLGANTGFKTSTWSRDNRTFQHRTATERRVFKNKFGNLDRREVITEYEVCPGEKREFGNTVGHDRRKIGDRRDE